MAIGHLLLASLGIPAPPRFYHQQRVDHFGTSAATFSQRYYLNDTQWQPGSPLLVIIGGEGAVPPSQGFFYPFVVDVLAPMMKALVIQPEHRFYGESLPFGAASFQTSNNLRLLTPQQALADTVSLIRATQAERNCSQSRKSPGYCPVFTIGGSCA